MQQSLYVPDYAMTTTCGASLAPNASCTLTITFTPSKTGQDNAFIDITDNASTSLQEVDLFGTGTKAGAQGSRLPPSDTTGGRRAADDDDD